MMFRRHEARKDLDAAGLNDEIMVAAAIRRAADFRHEKAASLCAVLRRKLLQGDDPVRQTRDVAVRAGSGSIIEQQRGAVPPGEILFERENLAPIAQRSLRK